MRLQGLSSAFYFGLVSSLGVGFKWHKIKWKRVLEAMGPLDTGVRGSALNHLSVSLCISSSLSIASTNVFSVSIVKSNWRWSPSPLITIEVPVFLARRLASLYEAASSGHNLLTPFSFLYLTLWLQLGSIYESTTTYYLLASLLPPHRRPYTRQQESGHWSSR